MVVVFTARLSGGRFVRWSAEPLGGFAMNAGRGAGRVRVTTPGGTSHEISITPDEVDALYVAGLKQKIETATGLPKTFQNLAAGPPEALKKLDDCDLLSELALAVEPTTSDGGAGGIN